MSLMFIPRCGNRYCTLRECIAAGRWAQLPEIPTQLRLLSGDSGDRAT